MWMLKTALITIVCSICWLSELAVLLAADTPADYLLPPAAPAAPPLPVPQRLTHAKAASADYQSPLLQHEVAATTSGQQSPSIISRVARWFGFASNEEPQTFAGTGAHQNSHWKDDAPPYIHKGDSKTPCYLCNNYPWVPMLPLSALPQSIRPAQNTLVQQWPDPVQQQHKYHAAHKAPQQFQPFQPYQQQKQQVHAPYQGSQGSQGNQLHQRDVKQNFQLPIALAPEPLVASAPSPLVQQELPYANAAPHFAENVGAHSERQLNHVRPIQTPPTTTEAGYNLDRSSTTASADLGFEIIKSEQVTHFVSSVEYPAEYEQAQTIDVPLNHRGTESNAQDVAELKFHTAEYQHSIFSPSLDQRTPASQLLTELGSFGIRGTEASSLGNEATFTEAPQYVTHKAFEPTVAADNYPAASVHMPLAGGTRDWRAFKAETRHNVTTAATTVIHPLPLSTPPSVLIERHQLVAVQHTPVRETPKRLLSAPLQHINPLANGPPRPFTRDPSDLNYRLGAIMPQPPTHQPLSNDAFITPAPLVASSDSILHAYDAGGQFANMSPPAPPPMASSGTQQIVIPYTTMNRPRPFESQWSHAASNHLDPYQQEESKLVAATAEAIKPMHASAKQPNNKYLTKVLASNLRELLRREHELQKVQHSTEKPVDLLQLQQNIDDWTEQEFTSLSHRPSTPTIRGRSKHIPAFYLTTTPAPQPSTAALLRHRLTHPTTPFDVYDSSLSASINNLESRLKDYYGSSDIDGTKRFGNVYQHIDDNRLHEAPARVNISSDATTESIETTKTFSASVTTEIAATTHSKNSKNVIISDEFMQATALSASPPLNAMQLWEKAKVLISPFTREKVYVVTPQPRFFPQHFAYATSTEGPYETTPRSPTEEHSSTFNKKPRFLVRPAPDNTINTQKLSKVYSPELFGLMDLSAFIPSKPVEIIDGNSKVVSVATPVKTWANNNDNLKREKSTKPTMLPLPR